MKKLVFTALAVVVFSGFAMAKNIELMKRNEITIQGGNVVDADCNAARFVAYVDAKEAGLTDKEASAASYSVYFMCMGLEASISQ